MSGNQSDPNLVEVLSPFQREQRAGLSIWHMGWLITPLAVGRDTGGRFTLVEATSIPGNEPPRHLHHREDELFYIVEGAMSFSVADQTFDATAGSSVFLPRGVPHEYRIVTDRVKALVLLTPAGMEGYFQELGEPARSLVIPPAPRKPNKGRVRAVSLKYEIEYV